MNLVYDHSAGAAAVYVPCLSCGKMVRLSDAVIDADGPAFKAYYHVGCLPSGTAIPKTCNVWDCARPHTEIERG